MPRGPSPFLSSCAALPSAKVKARASPRRAPRRARGRSRPRGRRRFAFGEAAFALVVLVAFRGAAARPLAVAFPFAPALRAADGLTPDPLEDRRDALADADAHRRQAQTDSRSAARELVHERRHEARARAAERVADRDGAAVDVDARRVERELAQARQRLRREGLR